MLALERKRRGGHDDDHLNAKVYRQLGEVRAACDGLATRSGLLLAATAIALISALQRGRERLYDRDASTNS